MRFSVIITNYNYKDFLPEAIESVLAQSHPVAEVIVVDDGSTDGSASLVRERYGTRVTLIESENGGQLSAFRLGVSRASGDYIAFLDADDAWMSDHLERAAAIAHKYPLHALIIANCEFTGEVAGRFYKGSADVDYGPTRQVLVTREWIGAPTSSLIARRDALNFLGGLPAPMLSDWRLRADDVVVFGVSVLGGSKYRMSEPTVQYRIHNRNGFSRVRLSREYRREYRRRQHRLFSHLLTISGREKPEWFTDMKGWLDGQRGLKWSRRRVYLRRMRRLGLIGWPAFLGLQLTVF